MSFLVDIIVLLCLHNYDIIKFRGGIFIIEYTILCIFNGGKPFYLQTFSSLQEAKLKLYDMVNLEIERNRPYYVDNDFFNNVYPYNLHHCKYFCIKQRNITEWENLFEIKKRKNNIIYFNKSC